MHMWNELKKQHKGTNLCKEQDKARTYNTRVCPLLQQTQNFRHINVHKSATSTDNRSCKKAGEFQTPL
jgi:hypothetical protein